MTDVTPEDHSSVARSHTAPIRASGSAKTPPNPKARRSWRGHHPPRSDLPLRVRIVLQSAPKTSGKSYQILNQHRILNYAEVFIKHATVRRYHYDSPERLRDHLRTFLEAYKFAKRLKSLKGFTVFEFITEKWTSEPDRFKVHPNHLSPGPNSWKPVTDTKAEPPSQLRETKRASTHPQPEQVEQAQLHFAGAAALKLF